MFGRDLNLEKELGSKNRVGWQRGGFNATALKAEEYIYKFTSLYLQF